jgi:hypothetical protein
MQTKIVKTTWKQEESTTGKDQNLLIVWNLNQFFSSLGEQRTCVDRDVITQYAQRFLMENWLNFLVKDVAKLKALPITKTMTSLWMSCGFASPATSSGTKS